MTRQIGTTRSGYHVFYDWRRGQVIVEGLGELYQEPAERYVRICQHLHPRRQEITRLLAGTGLFTPIERCHPRLAACQKEVQP